MHLWHLLHGYAMSFETAIHDGVDLACDVAVCGVDNNAARVAAARIFGLRNIPVVFTAVTGDTDRGYVFIQETAGPCIGCMFPDIEEDKTFPCPGIAAIANILTVDGRTGYVWN